MHSLEYKGSRKTINRRNHSSCSKNFKERFSYIREESTLRLVQYVSLGRVKVGENRLQRLKSKLRAHQRWDNPNHVLRAKEDTTAPTQAAGNPCPTWKAQPAGITCTFLPNAGAGPHLSVGTPYPNTILHPTIPQSRKTPSHSAPFSSGAKMSTHLLPACAPLILAAQTKHFE